MSAHYRAAEQGQFSTQHARGQGVVEYLVIIAVVLIISLMAAVLLANSPGPAADIRASTSAAYWSSQASPFLITNQNLSADGVLTLTLLNSAPTTMEITNMNISGTGLFTSSSTAPLNVATGKRALATIFLNGSCVPNQMYELNVNMTLLSDESELPYRIQSGAEPLVGRCNEASVMPAPVPSPPPGLLPNGAICDTPNDCESHHCHKTEVGKICVECEGNGHCVQPPQTRCFNYVCHKEGED